MCGRLINIFWGVYEKMVGRNLSRTMTGRYKLVLLKAPWFENSNLVSCEFNFITNSEFKSVLEIGWLLPFSVQHCWIQCFSKKDVSVKWKLKVSTMKNFKSNSYFNREWEMAEAFFSSLGQLLFDSL